jgi:hypothetical protein
VEKGKRPSFSSLLRIYKNEIFWNNRGGRCDVRFPIQSQINLNGRFINDVLANKRQQIKINLHKVKSDYAGFNSPRNKPTHIYHM